MDECTLPTRDSLPQVLALMTEDGQVPRALVLG